VNLFGTAEAGTGETTKAMNLDLRDFWPLAVFFISVGLAIRLPADFAGRSGDDAFVDDSTGHDADVATFLDSCGRAIGVAEFGRDAGIGLAESRR